MKASFLTTYVLASCLLLTSYFLLLTTHIQASFLIPDFDRTQGDVRLNLGAEEVDASRLGPNPLPQP